MWFHGIDDAIDRAVERVAREAAEPFLVRRALTEFRSPSHTLTCAIRRAPDPAELRPAQWVSGRAVITPQRFVFAAGPDGPALLRLDVRAVVETRETRVRDDRSSGPYRLAVWKLLTSDGTLYWAAHKRVLAEAAAVLRGTGRTT